MNSKKAKLIRRALALGRPVSQYVTKAPALRLYEHATPAGVELAQARIVQPIHLKPGSDRATYKAMKHMESTVGLDTVFRELQGGSL